MMMTHPRWAFNSSADAGIHQLNPLSRPKLIMIEVCLLSLFLKVRLRDQLIKVVYFPGYQGIDINIGTDMLYKIVYVDLSRHICQRIYIRIYIRIVIWINRCLLLWYSLFLRLGLRLARYQNMTKLIYNQE